ncbi:MAG TPA: J domain-containing protein, partial [Bryobacteraceae bacterium]|nr:J domain-containing protein [Bryobacteraceae bacterium]
MPFQRADEITYYDELGLERDASPEQIRDSFRSLVRLLHPDQQTDQQLKEIAERQMRKLNRIHAVLSDPEKRRRYDEDLDEERRRRPTIIFSPASNINPRRFVARLMWAGAAVLTVGILIWLAADGNNALQVDVTERASTASRTAAASSAPPSSGALDPVDEVIQLRSDLRMALAERDAAMRELARIRGVPGNSRKGPVPPASEAPDPDPVPSTAAADPTNSLIPPTVPRISTSGMGSQLARLSPATPDRGGLRQFAGFWFYSRPPRTTRRNNLYPPEFIEATLSDQNGVIRGKYRSRYQIVDRAISPDV